MGLQRSAANPMNRSDPRHWSDRSHRAGMVKLERAVGSEGRAFRRRGSVLHRCEGCTRLLESRTRWPVSPRNVPYH